MKFREYSLEGLTLPCLRYIHGIAGVTGSFAFAFLARRAVMSSLFLVLAMLVGSMATVFQFLRSLWLVSRSLYAEVTLLFLQWRDDKDKMPLVANGRRVCVTGARVPTFVREEIVPSGPIYILCLNITVVPARDGTHT